MNDSTPCKTARIIYVLKCVSTRLAETKLSYLLLLRDGFPYEHKLVKVPTFWFFKRDSFCVLYFVFVGNRWCHIFPWTNCGLATFKLKRLLGVSCLFLNWILISIDWFSKISGFSCFVCFVPRSWINYISDGREGAWQWEWPITKGLITSKRIHVTWPNFAERHIL